MALFKAAEVYTDRTVGGGPAGFVDHLTAQDLPADSVAARGVRTEAVQVLTPAAAAGEEWQVVVVAGLQEDVWPDLRLRDSLLGAGALADVEAGRSADGRRAVGAGPPPGPRRRAAHARRRRLPAHPAAARHRGPRRGPAPLVLLRPARPRRRRARRAAGRRPRAAGPARPGQRAALRRRVARRGRRRRPAPRRRRGAAGAPGGPGRGRRRPGGVGRAGRAEHRRAAAPGRRSRCR